MVLEARTQPLRALPLGNLMRILRLIQYDTMGMLFTGLFINGDKGQVAVHGQLPVSSSETSTWTIRLVEPVWTTRLVNRTTEPLRTGVRKDIPWILRQTISLGSPCSQAAAIKADSTNQEAVRAANRVPW